MSMECTCLLLAMPMLVFGSSFGSITFDLSSTVESMDIGWLEFASCAEGSNPLVYNSEYTFAELLELAEYAVTVQIGYNIMYSASRPLWSKAMVHSVWPQTIHQHPGAERDYRLHEHCQYLQYASICTEQRVCALVWFAYVYIDGYFENRYELSMTLNMTASPPVITGPADTSDWIGTTNSLLLLENYCDSTERLWEPLPLINVTYWGCQVLLC